MKQESNIKVAVRIRPILEDERKTGHSSQKLELDQDNKCINVFNDRTSIYKNSQFDYILDQSSTQRKVYDKVGISDLVKAVVEGYHATIFAYGQTGSGKTYTMEGYKYRTNDKGIPVPIIESNSENEGIVPRAIHQLFELIKQQANLQKKRFTVYCSYLQVYKEKIFDLLNQSQLKRLMNDGPGLKLRWNKNDHFSVENLYTFECRTPEDVMALYHFGIKNKVVASHNMNSSSSRSHTMLSITLEQVDGMSPDNIITSKFQLVDLAGSERQALTGNQVTKESIDINKGLFTLRQVITALTEKMANTNNQSNVNNNIYVPYRESKLTSLLRQSLGGNSFCLMIACLNPCDAYIDENISTLQYASKAQIISNKPVKNDDPKIRVIDDLKKENRFLTQELAKANETIQILSQLAQSNQSKSDSKQIDKNGLNGGESNNNTTAAAVIQTNVISSLELNHINQIILGDTSAFLKERQGSASSAITEKRDDQSQQQQQQHPPPPSYQQLSINERLQKDKDEIERFFKEKTETLQNIARPLKVSSSLPSAVNESKDAITERIIHTVNMMKEVLQSNLNLRETIQNQSEIIDNLNAEIFQITNESEDLRTRLQILEEYTGKDTYSDMTKLVRQKQVLENRVKHLEQTSMNWAQQFQATRSQFNQKGGGKESQSGMMKATLSSQFNDDYEPVRCNIQQEVEGYGYGGYQGQSLKDLQKVNNKNIISSKPTQISVTKHLAQGIPTKGGHSVSHIETEATDINNRHQEFKIRTVQSLTQAYQQNHNNNNNNKSRLGQTTKSCSSNNQQNNMNYTIYDKPRHSFQSKNLTGVKFTAQNLSTTQEMGRMRNKSPLVSQNQIQHIQKQLGNIQIDNAVIVVATAVKKNDENAQPHITLRKKDEEEDEEEPAIQKMQQQYQSSPLKKSQRSTTNNNNNYDYQQQQQQQAFMNNSADQKVLSSYDYQDLESKMSGDKIINSRNSSDAYDQQLRNVIHNNNNNSNNNNNYQRIVNKTYTKNNLGQLEVSLPTIIRNNNNNNGQQ